jgi:MFS family permease
VVAGSSVRRPRRLVLDTRPLAIRPYRRLWASTIVTAVGSQLTVVTIPVQLYTITGSSAYVGLAGLSGLVALIAFGLRGGAIADVVDRRRMLLVTTVLRQYRGAASDTTDDPTEDLDTVEPFSRC